MTQNSEEPVKDVSATIEAPTITVQEERSLIPGALEEDRALLDILDAEVTKRQERVTAARASLSARRETLWQAQTRQDTARRLYVLSKNMMEAIRKEGQLKGPAQNPRDSTSRHGRSLSNMDESRQALVDRTVATLRDSIAELTAAGSDLTIAQKNVTTAEEFIEYAERSLEAIQFQMRITRGFISEEEMKTRPTPKLPEDVWRRIFLAAVAEESELPHPPQDIFSEWEFKSYALPLSHVNREWRRITTSTPALWAGVQIVFTRERKLRSRLFRRVVSLASSSPLRISITLTSDVGSLANQLADAFTEDQTVRRIKIQCTDYASPGVRNLLDAIPAAQHLNFRGLTIPMGNNPTPIRIPSKHVMGASTISVSDLILERVPPFFLVPPPPWNLQTLHADIPSLLRIDIGGTSPSLRTLVIYQPLSIEHGPPWYETAIAFNVEGVTATEVVVNSMSRGHIAPLLRYISRLRSVTRLELHGTSVHPIVMAMKDNIEAAQKIWFPSLTTLVIDDYEQHGQALGLFVAARLDLAQRTLTEDIGTTVQPLQQVILTRCSKFSEDIEALIEQHCDAGRKMVQGPVGEMPHSPQST